MLKKKKKKKKKKDWGWSWSSNTLTTCCKELTHLKRPCAGKDWRQKKGTTKDEMIEWYHRLDGQEFEQTLGDSEEKGSLECCIPWGHRVWHDWVTERKNVYEIQLI